MARATTDDVRLRLAQAERELRRVNRALRMLSDADKALIRITDEPALLCAICRIAVEGGHYRLAWIGFAEPGVAGGVRPVAQVGLAPDGLEVIARAVAADGNGRGPVATALRSARASIARDLPEDPAFGQSAIALPLAAEGRTIGVLCMYAAEPDGFDDHEVGILSELADDLAFGLAVLRTRAERDRSAAALRLQLRMNEAILNQAVTGFALMDPQYRFLQVNESFARNYGRRPADFIGQRLDQVAPPYGERADNGRDSVDAVVASHQPIHGIAQPYTFVDQPERGITYWDWSLQPIFDERGEVEYLCFSSLDVTERTRAEQAVLARERELRTLSEHSPDVIVRFDRDGRYLYANRAVERLLKLPASQLIGRRIGEPLRGTTREPVADEIRAMRDGIARAFDTGMPVEVEISLPDPDGAKLFDVRLIPELDDAGEVVSVLSLGRDVTSRRQAEVAQRQLEDQLRHSQKMEAVGQLAGGIAHDFNNLLMVIKLQSSLLSGVRTRRELEEGLQEIMAATDRAANLTRQLLTFSRREVRQARDLDLTEIGESMTSLLRRLLGEDITLETRFDPELPLINADPGMMEQVLMNLVVNARDAMPEGGRLTVGLALAIVGDDEVAAHPQAAPGRFVCLSVVDRGCGIAPENLSRVFEPFFTTKEVGRGTGLGLATVFGIVQQHQGWVDVESEVGRGTTFRIYLPVLDRMPARPAAAAVEPASRGGSETILLVEDDATLRKLARVVLDRQGYNVLEAGTAAGALAICEEQRAHVDLLLTDLIIPGGMSGYELGKEMAARQPGLKVVYTSGYSNDIVHRRLHLDPGRNFLQKPYPVLDLASAVRRCLDER